MLLPFFAMKTFFILSVLLPLASFAQWELIWSDEFDATSLNQSYWTNEIGTGSWGWGNNELQYYTDRPENIFLDSGYLHIQARNEAYQGSNYTSARIKTQDKFSVQYGKIEARIKVPVGQGLWPAFWMLGQNISTIGWPKCGEIDIMEHVNHELKIHGTIHFDMWGHNYTGNHKFADASIFHVYAIEWDENEIRWFMDGEQFHVEAIDANEVSREEFHSPFFILLNLAVGGNWPGSPNASTPFPSIMMVDYVRVYQKGASIDEQEKTIEVQVYPNPTSDYLQIECEDSILHYKLCDLVGKVVLEETFSGTIDVKGIKAGTYALELVGKSGTTYRKKIVIQ